MGVHAYTEGLARGIAEAAARCFPVVQGGCKPPMRVMPDAAWDIIRAKRDAHRLGRKAVAAAADARAKVARGAGGLPARVEA